MTKTVFMRTPSGEIFETAYPDYHADCETLTRTAGIAARKEYCRKELRKIIKPGQVIYTVLRHVSTSGMSRRISLFIAVPAKNGRPASIQNIDNLAADATGYKLDKNGGIRIGGCGMDMGFELVYSLGAALWPHGTRKPHGTRNGEPDTSGGYALKHEWI